MSLVRLLLPNFTWSPRAQGVRDESLAGSLAWHNDAKRMRVPKLRWPHAEANSRDEMKTHCIYRIYINSKFMHTQRMGRSNSVNISGLKGSERPIIGTEGCTDFSVQHSSRLISNELSTLAVLITSCQDKEMAPTVPLSSSDCYHVKINKTNISVIKGSTLDHDSTFIATPMEKNVCRSKTDPLLRSASLALGASSFPSRWLGPLPSTTLGIGLRRYPVFYIDVVMWSLPTMNVDQYSIIFLVSNSFHRLSKKIFPRGKMGDLWPPPRSEVLGVLGSDRLSNVTWGLVHKVDLLLRPPGKKRRYFAMIMVDVVGMIISSVSGLTLITWFQREVRNLLKCLTFTIYPFWG